MRLRVCLILLLSGGVTLLLAPPDLFGFPSSPSAWGLRQWRNSLGAFSIPGCLFVLSFGKNRFIVGCSLAWGMWMSLISSIAALNVPSAAPGLPFWGTLLLASVFVVSAGTVVFAAIRLSQLGKKKKKATSAPVNAKPPLRKAS